jgi:phage-related protein
MAPSLKPIEWISSSLSDLQKFPEEVQKSMGFSLYLAQLGQKHQDAKPLKGFKGSGVLESWMILMETLIELSIR